MTFCENQDVREFSTFDDTALVKEVTITQAKLKANRLIMKCLKPEYATKVANDSLSQVEAFDLMVGEVEITTAILCKAYAIRYTMYKYNRSISTGQIGGESDRDSVKNIDFLEKMFPMFWNEGWGSIAEYVTEIPNIGGALDPYSTFNFSVLRNINLDKMLSGSGEELNTYSLDEVVSTIDNVNYVEWG